MRRAGHASVIQHENNMHAFFQVINASDDAANKIESDKLVYEKEERK